MNDQNFFDIWKNLQGQTLTKAIRRIENASEQDVAFALSKTPVTSDGFLALLSDSADTKIEKIEKAAQNLTAQRFGHTVNLYIPLYLSNHCVNSCLYCHFGKDNPKREKTLTMAELKQEAERILSDGYKSILLVAGENIREVSLSYIANSIKLLKEMGFVFVGIETQTFTEDEYRLLGQAGLDGVTVYQETYDRKVYERVHPRGPKKDFEWRMGAPERVAKAGIRFVGVGFLLGLSDYRREAVNLMSHVKYMQKKYWQTMVSISFPRIHAAPENFDIGKAASDSEFVRLILAARLLNPDTPLTLSTREAPALRDRLFGVGITQVSAGSKTSPGAYSITGPEEMADEQFPVEDTRSPKDVVKAIRLKGLDQVWKDWDMNLKPVSG